MRSFLSFLAAVLGLYSVYTSGAALSPRSSRQSNKRSHRERSTLFTDIKGGFTSSGSILRSSTRRMAVSSNHLRKPEPSFNSKNKFRGRRLTETRFSNGIVYDDMVAHQPPLLRRYERRIQQPRNEISKKTVVKPTEMPSSKQTSRPWMKKLDLAIFCTYMCSAVSVNLPVILLPLAAAEQATGQGVGSVVAAITSVAIVGAGVGKVVNGFICQEAGGRNSSSWYLLGCAACSLLFSMVSTKSVGLAYAGMEFFASMQWTALNVILANHYAKDPASFAMGITVLSLSSTAGQLLAKMLGMTLLQHFDWRTIAQFGSIIALAGSFVVRTFITEHPEHVSPPKEEPFEWKRIHRSIVDSGRNVLTNPLFWAVGFAHTMAMLARSSDRILGAFFQEATALPRSICGGLTLSITLGFIHGLVRGRAFHEIKDVHLKKAFVKRRYFAAVLSTLTLALFAHGRVASYISSQLAMAAAVVMSSGVMASGMAFQFFSFPAMLSKTFGRNKAVCLSFLDSIAYFMAAPIWATVGKMIPNWSIVFVMLAALFGAGGVVMTKSIPMVMERQAIQS